MNFYQLLYFSRVARTNSVSRAAEELNITQPAVSKQILALENELGERLFDRIGKKVYLTRAGETLAARADRILQSVQEARTAVQDLSAECSGELIIGTSDHISIHRLPDLLKAFITAYPKVDLKLRCHRSESVLDLVENNRVDLGVITLPKITKNVVAKTVWHDPMSLVVPAGHPLAARRTASLKDTVAYGMILVESSTTTRKEIEDAYAEKGLAPNVTMEAGYIETIK
ncbi:MAG TPA: LysR family transcriptional regulator, partial [Dissulfurispiraceae bacterium]|nr:LysR family transcriptional regulator [Dissulfurispiraceae bacterium]